MFYERQKGAYAQRLRVESERMYDEFPNCAEAIEMEAMAQLLAAADPRIHISNANSPSKVFESKQIFGRVFAPAHIESAKLSVLLYNVWRATKFALREIKSEAAESNALRAMTVGSLTAATFRLFLQHAMRRELQDVLNEYADEVHPARGGRLADLRCIVRSELRTQKSGIERVLKDTWFDESEGRWGEYTDQRRMDAAMQKIRPKPLDPFTAWGSL